MYDYQRYAFMSEPLYIVFIMAGSDAADKKYLLPTQALKR